MRFDSSKVGPEVERIRLLSETANLDFLDELIREARNPASVLHGWFTWDIQQAAYKQLREEARLLIKAVSVTFSYTPTETLLVPLYVSTSDDAGDRHYDSVINVMGDAERRQQLVRETLQRALGILRNIPDRVCQKLADQVEKELGKL